MAKPTFVIHTQHNAGWGKTPEHNIIEFREFDDNKHIGTITAIAWNDSSQGKTYFMLPVF